MNGLDCVDSVMMLDHLILDVGRLIDYEATATKRKYSGCPKAPLPTLEDA